MDGSRRSINSASGGVSNSLTLWIFDNQSTETTGKQTNKQHERENSELRLRFASSLRFMLSLL